MCVLVEENAAKMSHLAVIYCVFLCGFFTQSFTTVPEYREECGVWQQAIEDMKKEDNLQEVECTTNQQCTGIDCQGRYYYKGVYTFWQEVDIDLCFGLALHPCHNPEPDLEIYVWLTQTNTTWQRNVSHTDLYPIEGAHMEFHDMAVYDGFMQVNMTNTQIEGHRYMELGLYFKMRQTIYGFEHWPDDFQITLVPDMMVPVPDCSKDVVTPGHQPYTCGYTGPTIPPHANTNDSSHDTSKSLPVNVKTTPLPRSYLPGNTCTLSNSFKKLMENCGSYQACRPLDGTGKVSVCTCSNGYEYNLTSKLCVPAVTGVIVDDVIIIPVPGDADISPKSHLPTKTIIIIVACSVGGVLILAAAVAAVFCKYQAYRRRYGQHELLLNNEDDPLDIPT